MFSSSQQTCETFTLHWVFPGHAAGETAGTGACVADLKKQRKRTSCYKHTDIMLS